MLNSGSIRVTKDVAVQYDASNLENDYSLDRQLAEAEARVVQLRRRKNEHALISRLPVEILIQVFSYYTASDRRPHVRFRTPPPWLAVTHVCQRWRHASLSCPILWVDIISTNYRWAEEMLERSGDLPIHITVDDGGPSAQMPCEVRTARLLFSKIHRAQSLVMTCTDRLLAFVPDLFEVEAAPLLQELTITNFHPSSAVDLVERPLFSGRTPSLQFLSLYHCCVLWSSPLFQCDLVYLFISHIPHEHRPHLQQLLDVLKCLVRLECLQLDEALPIHIPSPADSLSSVLSVERLFLHHLRFFSLCAKSAFDILDLTARVLVPASALFQLICEEFEQYTPSDDSGDVMLAALASHLCAPRGTPAGSSASVDVWAPVKSLHVRDIPAARSWSLFAGTGGPVDTGNDRDNQDTEATSGSSSSFDKNNDNADKDARPPNPADEQMHILLLHLRWHAFPTSARSAAYFIQRAARLPPLVRASTLLIESALFESATAWRAAFARARHVRAVFAGGSKAVAGAAKMLRDMCQPQPQSQSREQGEAGGEDADVYAAIARLLPSRLAFERPAENPSQVLFPKLRRLAIAGADFEDIEAGLFESLRAGLVARKESDGGSLAQLSIWRCDVLKDQLDALGALVAESKVRWDGVLSSSRPASEARVGNAELSFAHAATAVQGNDWQAVATIMEEPEMGHGDDDLPPVEGHNPLLVPGELGELDED